MKKIGNFLRGTVLAALIGAVAYQLVPLVAGSFMHAWNTSSKIEARKEPLRMAVRENTFLNVCPEYRDHATWFNKWYHHLNWCEDYLDRLPPK